MMRSLNNIVFLLIAGLPIIYASSHFVLTTSEVQFASVNDLVTLRCSLSYKHLPENVKIEWFDGPLAITAGVNGMTMEHTKTNAKLESLLTIPRVEHFHFGQYKCKATGIEGQSLTANTLLMPRGTNGDGRNFISNINLTYPEQVLLKCNNILSENKNKVSWKKVQFNQSVVSLDVKTDSFNDSVPSLSGTGKFICYNNDTVFHITYVYPQDYQPLRFTENLPNNATLLYNNTNPILLTCTVPMSTATTKLYWMLNNEVLNTDLVKRVNVPNMIHKQSELELQLIITSPIPTMDTGVYTCVAENEWERIERHTSIRFDISDADPYNIVSFSSQQYMIDGSEFTASCVISRLNKGTYLNVFMLYSNGLSMIQLMNDDNTIVRHTIEDYIVIATVTIKKATASNNGTYLCYATAGFAGKPVMQSTTAQFIERPVEIVNYYKDPMEQHSITCKAHIFVTTFMNSTSIQFTHHTNHHQHDKAVVYHPTSTVVNDTEMSITAHLDLKIVHGQKYHGVYECVTSASVSDKLYSDSKSLAVEQTTKKHTASVLTFSVQSSTDQSLNNVPTTNTIYVVAGVTVAMVATAVLLVVVVHQRLRRSRHTLLNEPHFV